MALLAKYYLTYSNPMGMEHDFDSRRRTYHNDGSWRPPLLAQQNHAGPTSAPNSPRGPRKSSAWRDVANTGTRNSCDNGESFQPVAQQIHHTPRQTATRHSFRSHSSFRSRRVPLSPQNSASAPTSPHFGIDGSESVSKLSAMTATAEKSMPTSPMSNNGEQRQSPPMKIDLASSRRSRYASLRRKPKNQSFAGVPTNEFNSSTTSMASPPHSGGSEGKCQKENIESPLTRRRCASGPLNDDTKRKISQSKTPELLVTLSYSKNLSFITVTITKARNLTENANIFVRLHLYEGCKPISLKQTSVFRGGANVEIKQAFMFSLTKDGLWSTHLLLELFENDVIGNELKYGDVVIGPKANGNGFSQWRQVCTHPNIPCGMWHTLT